MSVASVFTELIKSSPHIARMTLNLLYIYLTLGSRVRKARRAFEDQVIRSGMPREHAERLSSCFEELKDDITRLLKEGLSLNEWHQ